MADERPNADELLIWQRILGKLRRRRANEKMPQLATPAKREVVNLLNACRRRWPLLVLGSRSANYFGSRDRRPHRHAHYSGVHSRTARSGHLQNSGGPSGGQPGDRECASGCEPARW